MKCVLTSILFSAIFLTCVSFPGVSMAEPAPDLKGPITRAQLDSQKYEWMIEGLAHSGKEFALKKNEIGELKQAFKNVDVEIYFGSWCGDSHDHLPTFLALVDTLKPEGPKSVTLFARDRKKGYGGYKSLRTIERLPTFVFLRDGKEIGRITETPKTGILEDTRAILLGKK